MARPRIEIDKENFEKLCGLQCTEKEICSFFGITDKTLTSWCNRTYNMSFSEVFEEKRGTGKISLRRAQFELAKKNAAMAIFLGKQYLGQTDKPLVEINTSEGNVDVNSMGPSDVVIYLPELEKDEDEDE